MSTRNKREYKIKLKKLKEQTLLDKQLENKMEKVVYLRSLLFNEIDPALISRVLRMEINNKSKDE
jgi:uncharacterized protein YutE (UPF0331/DUF86 family)